MRPPEPESLPLEFLVTGSSAGIRLDVFLAAQGLPYSRSQLTRRIAEGEVRIDGAAAKPGLKLRPGQRITFTPPPVQPARDQPEPIPLRVLFEDRHLIVIDKPAGMVVHPAPGHPTGTLVNALLHHCGSLPLPPAWPGCSVGADTDASAPDGEDRVDTGREDGDDEDDGEAEAGSGFAIGGQSRPGIVHRLDQGTSGILVCAKDEPTLVGLQAQFQRHSIARRYLAIVHGRVATEGSFRTPYGRHPRDRKRFTGRSGGKHAITHYSVIEPLADGEATLVEARLETGRTHQIRVHFSEAGHPLLGDPLYGAPRPPPRSRLRPAVAALTHQALHARLLGFTHPITAEWLEFSTPPPSDFLDVLAQLRRAEISPSPSGI